MLSVVFGGDFTGKSGLLVRLNQVRCVQASFLIRYKALDPCLAIDIVQQTVALCHKVYGG